MTPNENETPIQIDPFTLKRMNVTSVVATTRTTNDELVALFAELQTEERRHTWSFFHQNPGDNLHERLEEFENKRRETHFFYYEGLLPDGRRELIGVGTIASKIRHAFPSLCFPVISRCFIRSKYRGNRLYFPILRHRFDVCHQLWGKDLLGIHLGTANPHIINIIQSQDFGLGFVFVGVENLDPGRSDVHVHDYLYLAPRFAAGLMQVPDSVRTATSVVALLAMMDGFVTNQADPSSFLKLKNMIHDVRAETGWSALDNETIGQFVLLLESIPVLETRRTEKFV